MNSRLAWITGLALAIGVTLMTNLWLGIAAGAGWAFYARSRRPQGPPSPSDRDVSAVAAKERIDRMRQSSDDDPFLFWIAAAAVLVLGDRMFLDGILRRGWDELGWRSVFTWGFWSFVVASWLLSVMLRKVFFGGLMLVARMRYPRLDSALPILTELSIRDGVLGWGDLDLHMTPAKATSVIGYESILEIDTEGDLRTIDALHRGRRVVLYWHEPADTVHMAELYVRLTDHELSVGSEACLTRIQAKFPVLKRRRDELLLSTPETSILHVSKYERSGSLHLIRAAARDHESA